MWPSDHHRLDLGPLVSVMRQRPARSRSLFGCASGFLASSILLSFFGFGGVRVGYPPGALKLLLHVVTDQAVILQTVRRTHRGDCQRRPAPHPSDLNTTTAVVVLWDRPNFSLYCLGSASQFLWVFAQPIDTATSGRQRGGRRLRRANIISTPAFAPLAAWAGAFVTSGRCWNKDGCFLRFWFYDFDVEYDFGRDCRLPIGANQRASRARSGWGLLLPRARTRSGLRNLFRATYKLGG